jgi:hypothetical protein
MAWIRKRVRWPAVISEPVYLRADAANAPAGNAGSVGIASRVTQS